MVDADALRIEKAIRKIQESGDESDLIDVLLQGALNWPLSDEGDEDIKIDDISYSWDDVLVEMGFSSADAPIELRQVMPFPNWPHGIFIVKFGSSKFFTQNRGMTRPLRTILRELMEKVRPTADHPSWKKEHLLFLCHSETEYFEFARFEDPKGDSKTAKLQMFGWGPNDHIRTVCEHNLTNLIYKQGMNEEEATETVASAFDVSKVSKKFYEDYKNAFENAKPIIAEYSSITDANEIHQTTQTLFNRILFLRFIEKKGWLHFGETDDYLRELFKAGGVDSSTFYSSRLKRLFFEGLAIEGKQNDSAYGEVPFLNGGLFEESKFDKAISDLPNEMFDPLLGEDGLFYNYNFTVQESTSLDIDVAIDPEMIGTMFEKLVTDRGGKGAFYTPRVVVAYMCREAIKSVLEERTEVNAESIRKLVDDDDDEGLLIDDARIINSVLAEVKAIDPACGSGAYLLGLLHELVRVHTKLSTTAEDLTESRHKMKLRIISRSIYGVDLDPFATNIARLRLWLSLSVEAHEPLPLPNLDFNIETGDSLLAPNPTPRGTFDFTGAIKKADALALKKEVYLEATGDTARELRAEIKAEEAEIRKLLRKQNDEIGSVDYRVHFASVFTKNGGFDIVLANPPYVRQEDLNASFKKKLFANYSAGVAESGLVKRSDLYCYFYVRASQLLRGNGVMAFICSNSWLDVDFGKPLKKFLKNNQHLVSIINSSKERQFVSAAVNTIISVSKKVSGHSKGTKFINLQGGFEDSVSNPEMRTEYLVEFDNLDPEEKWLLFTKAPEIYFQALEGGLFQRLENFGLITRGFTSGANDFFFIPKGTRPEIESRFLKPVIKTPREVTGIMVNEEMLANEVFLCQPSKRILKNEFPGAHAYVKEGEEKIIEIKRGKDKGTELVGYNSLSTTKSRPQWYTLPKLKRADVLLRQFYNDKFDFPLNPLGLPCDHTFYYIHLPAEAEGYAHTEYSESDHKMKILRLGAYLNSSISWMFVEVLGRKNMGEGVLTCYGPEMRPFPTLDPNRLEGVEDLFKPLTKRPVESVFKELGLDPELPISGQTPNPKPDRKALDDFVFDIVSLDEEQRTQVYLSLCEMVQNRLSKAKTIL
jgi:type I restriction-modification system DNA methylase subunit